jgi:hypothetical protein
MHLIYQAHFLLMLSLSPFNKEAILFLSTTFNSTQDYAMFQTVSHRAVPWFDLGAANLGAVMESVAM